MREAIERQGEPLLARLFTPEERAYCAGLRHPWPSYAARFAAKEAVAKAFLTGIGAEVGWRSVGVVHGRNNAPEVVLDDRTSALFHAAGGRRISLSLSHTDATALALVALLGD
jgi:holo-[acyl-carrier protein] synthase